jgi:uncharacterized membrane protein
MNAQLRLFVCGLLISSVALAQTAPAPTPAWTAPPLVPVDTSPGPNGTPPPPPVPAVTGQPNTVGTPPPPSGVAPNAQQPYSPYGTPGLYPGMGYGQQTLKEKPSPEIGLMVSESLFGMLSAAGVTLLPYFLLFGNGVLGLDPTVSSILFSAIFAAAPLAVAQTQVSLANGSRYYTAEMWPAALSGLAAEAGVLAIFYATGWLPQQQVSGGVASSGGSVAWLMIGSVALVPLVQMAVLNLTKAPKFRLADAGPEKKELGVALLPPVLTPVLGRTSAGLSVGASLSFLNGQF